MPQKFFLNRIQRHTKAEHGPVNWGSQSVSDFPYVTWWLNSCLLWSWWTNICMLKNGYTFITSSSWTNLGNERGMLFSIPLVSILVSVIFTFSPTGRLGKACSGPRCNHDWYSKKSVTFWLIVHLNNGSYHQWECLQQQVMTKQFSVYSPITHTWFSQLVF